MVIHVRRIVNAGLKIVKGPNVHSVRCGKQGHGNYGTFLMFSTTVLSSQPYVQVFLMVQHALTLETVREDHLVRLVCALQQWHKEQLVLKTMIVKSV